ncbi:MAG TPA: hypothetical protein VGR06_28260 [Actinophytocola sp.]|uniref:hypothetical protein n=1 Tax=Actinophytocola sp. TaxID=1872138 RepID=UPI002DFDB8B7|nr:hypothetical protein [Actinophytocola sp.]
MRMVITALAALVVAGCSAEPPAARPNVPAVSSSAPVSSSAAKEVPKTCGGLATLGEITEILNAAVTGQTLPIVGVPEPKIGRTARLDCYYGVPDGQPVTAAVVTIGLATYTDETAAQRRLASTIETEREAGAKSSQVPVGPGQGVLLLGAKRMLVASRGRTTVVITVIPDLLPEDRAANALSHIAERALTPR